MQLLTGSRACVQAGSQPAGVPWPPARLCCCHQPRVQTGETPPVKWWPQSWAELVAARLRGLLQLHPPDTVDDKTECGRMPTYAKRLGEGTTGRAWPCDSCKHAGRAKLQEQFRVCTCWYRLSSSPEDMQDQKCSTVESSTSSQRQRQHIVSQCMDISMYLTNIKQPAMMQSLEAYIVYM